MINKSLIGRFGPDYEVPIELGKIREFARAAYAEVPAHMDGAHPLIPATFLVTAGVCWGYTLERPRGTLFETLGHDLSVPLHAEESYLFHRPPPRAGDQLIARSCLESVNTKQGSRAGNLTFLTMLTEFRDRSGDLVVEARSTTVTVEMSPTNQAWSSNPPEYKPDYEQFEARDPFAPITRQKWNELIENRGPGAISTGPLTLYEMVRFQAAGGEMNPLHYDAAHARAMGFPGLFGLGMHQASALASYAGRWLGEEHVHSFRARFPNVFWVGDALTYEGCVSRLYESGAERRVDLDLNCTRDDDGARVAQVWMTFTINAQP